MPNLAKLKIGEFVLDPSRDVLIGAEGEAALERKVVEVLLALAGRPNMALSRDELIDAVWKAEFGADERLTRAISLLRKAFGDERGAARYIETIPKRGYRLVATVQHVPRVESAPGSETDDSPKMSETGGVSVSLHASPVSSRPWRAWQAYAIAAGFAVGLGAAGIAWNLWRDPGGTALEQDVVELLPFVLIEGKPGLDAFARQVHASLKRIMSSNQVSLIDGTVRRPEAASGAAAVKASEFVLTGSLERIDDRYAVSLYFDSRSNGETLWSHRYMRGVGDGEELRDEVAAGASSIISCALEQRRAARTKPSNDAFKTYLEACDPVFCWGDQTKMLAVAQRLLEIAPDDPFGHALAAFAHARLVDDSSPPLITSQVESHRAAAHEAATRALELDPTNPLALTAEVLLVPQAQRWHAEHTYGSVDHPAARGVYIGSLRTSGRVRAAVHVAKQAVAATPLSAPPRTALAMLLMQDGAHEEADRLLEETLRLWPDSENTHWYRFVNTAFYGDAEKAMTLLEPTSKAVGWTRSDYECWQTFLEARRLRGGSIDGATVRKACESDEKSHQDYTARMLVALGDVDGAYDLLRGESFDWTGSTVFLFYPEMAPFRQDARFMPFVAKSGLLEYWTKSGRWPDFCNDNTLPYDCKAAAARALKDKKRTVTNVPPS